MLLINHSLLVQWINELIRIVNINILSQHWLEVGEEFIRVSNLARTAGCPRSVNIVKVEQEKIVEMTHLASRLLSSQDWSQCEEDTFHKWTSCPNPELHLLWWRRQWLASLQQDTCDWSDHVMIHSSDWSPGHNLLNSGHSESVCGLENSNNRSGICMVNYTRQFN